VSQWADQSGGGRHATQAAAASYPQLTANAVNGKPALSFDGANDFLTFNLPVNGLTAMTMVMVSANTVSRTGDSNGVSYAPLFWNETTSWGTVHLSPFQNVIKFRFGTTQANNLPAYTRPASAGTNFGTTMAIKNGSVETLYVDGQLALTASGKFPTIAGIRDTGNVGRGYNDNTYFGGRIAEILVYDRALTDAERLALEDYLRSKYFSTVNTAPSVNAGPDQAITLPSAATLAGSAADDGRPNNSLTSTWSKQSGPGTVTFADPSAASTTATFSASGSYVLRLTATDGVLSSFDEVTVTVSPAVSNTAPVVNAGADQSITLPASATLSGSATDDGLPGNTLTASWSKQSGPGIVTFGNESAASTTAAFSASGSYVLRLTATDGVLSSFDEVTVTVSPAVSNTAPVVNAGSDQGITLPASATLSGSATDDGLPSDTLTASWSKQSGPGTVAFANASAASTTATFSASGSYVLRLTATDGALTAFDEVSVSVSDAGGPPPPVPTSGLRAWFRADAGVTASGGAVSQWADQSGQDRHAIQTVSASYPQLVANVLNGKPALAFDGLNDFLTFNLPLNGLTGMTMVLVSSNTISRTGDSNGVAWAPLFWNETAGWGTVHLSPFQSLVKFRFGTTQPNNLPAYTRPASAGSSFGTAMAIKNGAIETLYLDGSLALTATGKLPTLAGIRDTGNVGRGYNDNTYFGGRIAEILVYDRALTDSERQAVDQYLRTKYFPPVNAAPAVNAGSDQLVNLPAAATLSGSATDDGLPNNNLTAAWTKQSGPGTVAFTDAAAASTTATFSAAGSYVLRLTASDGLLTTIDEVTVAVNDPNAPPLPVPTSGLKLWLRADAGVTQTGGAVSQWADQSGADRHAIQTVAASFPQFIADAVNGKPALAFDGANDFLTFNLPLNGLSAMTMVMVSSNTVSRTGDGNGVAYAPLFWNETASWGTVHLSPFQTVIKFRFGTQQSNNLPTYVRPASAGTGYGVTMAIKEGTVETLYVNGQLALTATGKLPTIAGIRDTGNVGRGYNDNTYFGGRIAEILVYDRALTAAERQALDQYLLAKYLVP
jgi:hypothetical protein